MSPLSVFYVLNDFVILLPMNDLNVNATDPRLERAAAGILKQIQEQLIIKLPFLNRAVLRMPYIPRRKSEDAKAYSEAVAKKKETLKNKKKLSYSEAVLLFSEDELPSTNGTGLYAAPEVLISMYRRDAKKLTRIYLHMIFHCLFCHPFRYEMLDTDLWDLCSDIAVENVVLELNKSDLTLDNDRKRLEYLDHIKELVAPLTADRLYHFFYRNDEERAAAEEVTEIFAQDSHWMWLASDDMFGGEIESSEGEDQFSSGEAEEQWKNTAGTIRAETEFLSKLREDLPGTAVVNIDELYKERTSYREFLKKFISPREEIRVNQDEFDYIYYTYGMKLYGNMPLIEPLEYMDDNKIHDLIIAIDTSGSCQGRIVKSFLNKTYTIFKDSGMFFNDFRVHLVMCDAEVQSDDLITSQRDFDAYISDLKIRGYGGTDFRPVFELADKYVREKEFMDLRGIIYFTDGLGIYPPSPPSCPTAFVIIEDPKEKARVPAWAIKHVTTLEELEKKDSIL